MDAISLDLHPAQMAVMRDPSRFKVIVAGRRWGKTRYAIVGMIRDLMTKEARGHNLMDSEVIYVAPTYKQASRIFWDKFLEAAGPAVDKAYIAEGKFRMASGRVGRITGSDIPDSLRGLKLSSVYLDEYAFMKPTVWEYIIRPALADVQGTATFIGTPDPASRNHFYDLYLQAELEDDWAAWQFMTRDNPFISPDEIVAAKKSMSTQAFQAEFEASFDTHGGKLLDPSTIEEGNDPGEGDVYMAIDPAGYRDVSGLTRAQENKLDETAIAIVKVHHLGWHVLDIIHGRWDIRETSAKILRAVQKYRPIKVGIERTSLSHAIRPFLEDQKRRFGISVHFEDLSHSSTTKTSRITWALQGRLEQGRITFEPGDYVQRLRAQAFEFPEGRHDDLLDALAYIDQMASTRYEARTFEDTWEPLDAAVGY